MSAVEPHADMRMAATSMYQMFTAYMDAGFTAEQAIQLLIPLLPRPESHP